MYKPFPNASFIFWFMALLFEKNIPNRWRFPVDYYSPQDKNDIKTASWFQPTPLKNMMSSSVGMMMIIPFPSEWKVIKFHGSKPPEKVRLFIPKLLNGGSSSEKLPRYPEGARPHCCRKSFLETSRFLQIFKCRSPQIDVEKFLKSWKVWNLWENIIELTSWTHVSSCSMKPIFSPDCDLHNFQQQIIRLRIFRQQLQISLIHPGILTH